MINLAQVVGIIAEYHPFHNGHLYQMRNARALTGASYCVVFLSSYFVQRGMPAIYSPLKRAEAALRAGADAVFEIPTPFSSASARDYAAYGVSMLAGLGIPNLCCGTEDVSAEELSMLLDVIDEGSEAFQHSLREGLKTGLTYAEARVNAIAADLFQAGADNSLLLRTRELLSKPNNILAFEYARAARAERIPIRLTTVSRKGSDYHDPILQGDFSSATAIRSHILNGGSWDDLIRMVPRAAAEVFASAPYLNPACMVGPIERRVLDQLYEGTALSSFSDVSEDLADRIANAEFREENYEALVNSLKTRQYTHTRVARALTHIFLGIRKSDLLRWKNAAREEAVAAASAEGRETGELPPIGAAPYARLLGFRRDSEALLSLLKQAATIPMVSRPAAAESLLRSPAARDLFQAEVHAADLWNSLCYGDNGTSLPSYLRQQIVIV